MSCDIGLWGLAVMGQNFALNMAEHGFSVAVGNRSQGKVEATVARAKAEGDLPITGSADHKDFCSKLSKPRKIIILVQAGKPVDDTIAQLSEYLEEGDIIVDGGNEWFPNTIRRGKELEEKGIMFVGMGISGGEEGARKGPSLMPGGPKPAYDLLENILTTCAAQVDDEACTGYLGPVGSGNYVKVSDDVCCCCGCLSSRVASLKCNSTPYQFLLSSSLTLTTSPAHTTPTTH
jgi:6-phosphogluconate dehydrogenase